MDWTILDWFNKSRCASKDGMMLVTPFGHFKNVNQFWNFCHNKWQSLSAIYYKNDLNDFRYFTTELSELGGIREYKERRDNGIYEMFIKPNCYNTVKIFYFKKEDNSMNANKRLQRDEHKLNKAQSTIKSVKHDIKNIRNQSRHSNEYLVLALYDCLNNNKTGLCDNSDDYYVVAKDDNGFMISSSLTFHEVMTSHVCWFDKCTATLLQDKLACNSDSYSIPAVLSKGEFEKKYGNCE